jgi:outer membrane receptor for ferric coprogen and ferric-rhodotorulic acid
MEIFCHNPENNYQQHYYSPEMAFRRGRFMSEQQYGGNGFSFNLMAMSICLATSQAAFAAEAETPATTLELGATEISGQQQLGTTTEGTQSYTTGAMATVTKLPLTLRETPQAVTVITANAWTIRR